MANSGLHVRGKEVGFSSNFFDVVINDALVLRLIWTSIRGALKDNITICKLIDRVHSQTVESVNLNHAKPLFSEKIILTVTT